jgi:transcriptional regulator with XRE-family HTH domain
MKYAEIDGNLLNARFSERDEQMRRKRIGEALVAAISHLCAWEPPGPRAVMGKWLEVELQARNLMIVATTSGQRPGEPESALTADPHHAPRDEFAGKSDRVAQEESAKCAFAHVLRYLRRRAGLSQDRLALETGFDRTYVSQLERAVSAPSLGTIFLLSGPLSVNPCLVVAMTVGRLNAMKGPAFDPASEPNVDDHMEYFLCGGLPPPEQPDVSKISKALGIATHSLRGRTGLTQDEVSTRAGTNIGYFGSIERGSKNPTLPVVLRLSNAVEVPAEFLVHGVEVLISAKLRESAFRTLVNSRRGSALLKS